MQYRRLGQSALKLSALSYGSWITFGTTLDDRAARDCLACAYDHGINFFDSAEVYLGGEAERMLGRAIKALAGRATAIACRARRCTAPPTIMRQEAGRARRSRALAASTWSRLASRRCGAGVSGPVPVPSTGPGHVDPGNRLDHAHAGATGQDPVLGHSEWPAADIETLCAFAERHNLVPPQLEQPQYSLFHRERVEHEYHPLVERRGLGLTTWSPLASGVLAGRYDAGVPADSRLAAEGFGWLRISSRRPPGGDAPRALARRGR